MSRVLLRSLTRIALVLLGVLLGARGALPCSCRPSTPGELFKDATTVFVGTPISRSTTSGGEYAFTFRVHKTWKGVMQPRVVVVTSNNAGTCGFPFKLGEQYLVYAYEPGQAPLRTGLCSGTASLSSAEPLLELLGPPTVTFVEAPGPSFLWLIVAGLVGAVVGGAVMAWWLSRRKSRAA